MNSHFEPQTESNSSHAIADLTPRSSTPISSSATSPPPVVYGELSILGYNGYIPNGERSGRRNKSKFLLCKRLLPNGIKKSRHYYVKQPQATRAIQDKDLHSISYTFTRSQTIIVEYKQDETTDMFQIGRSSEDPIDFVVMDTLPAGATVQTDSSASNGGNHQSGRHSSKHHSSLGAAQSSSSSSQPNNYVPQLFHSHHQHHPNENASSSQQQMASDLLGMTRFNRQLAKVGEEMLQYGFTPNIHDRFQMSPIHVNYPPPNISNLPAMVADHFRHQDAPMFYHPTSSQQQQMPRIGCNHPSAIPAISNSRDHSSSRHQQNSSRHNSDNLMCKRSHTTQSTISRFACRVIVDREPPFTARIYAAGFDSSKNIFLGEKATKWEQNNSIDGLTTNGVLLMHPKRGYFYEESGRQRHQKETDPDAMDTEDGDNEIEIIALKKDCSSTSVTKNDNGLDDGVLASQESKLNSSVFAQHVDKDTRLISQNIHQSGDSNNNRNDKAFKIKARGTDFEYGGVWREVSVDGGIYAIRESRSAVQKGKRIEKETNILQDGTLIDLCGATLLWRSLDGFKYSPTKKTLEEKIDMLNASRPQCPVGLNTLVIPRKPILPISNYRSSHHNHRKDHHSNKEDDRSGHQPYVYLKCGHVQGYHDWGATAKSNQRTCPICLCVGNVAKLSMGLEPSFYVDSGPLTHVFNPCGHMASERTVKYWCSINIPHGTHFFHSICPFCATPLANSEPPSTKLIFQGDLD